LSNVIQLAWYSMIAILSVFIHILVSPFKTQARLEPRPSYCGIS